MVQNRITDGTRIAQFLSSELTGLHTGLLEDVTVVDADRDADPSPEGTLAYRIAFRDEAVASVFLFPSGVEIRLDGDLSWTDDGRGLEVLDDRTLRVHTGAAVKQSVDCLGEMVERELRS